MSNEKLKTKSTVCSNCGGQLNIDNLKDTVECPYCGTSYSVSELTGESDAVRIEKIKSNTQKEIEKEKQKNENEKNNIQEEKEQIEKFKKSKFSKVLILFSVIGVLMVATAFNDGRTLAGLVAILMTVLFIITYLMKNHTIKEPKKGISTILAIVAFILIVPFMNLYNGENNYEIKAEKFEWNNIEMHEILPKPEKTYGKIGHNSEKSLILTLCKVTEEDFKSYRDLCIQAGFTIEPDKSSFSYKAFNEEGYSVNLVFSSSNEEMNIYLDAPEEMAEFEWPTSGLGAILPIPKSNIGKISWNNSETFIVHLGNTNIQEYNEYVKSCEQKGFTIDYSKGDTTYSALNQEGYKISLMYLGFNRIEIALKAPEKTTTEITTNETTANETTPTETTTPSTSTETSKPSSETVGVSKEFKEAMDSYEKFFDEYVAFMKKYKESNGTDVSLLADYSRYMNQYAETMKKFEDMKDDDMNTAETAYYIEVQNRINQKLLEVAQ